MSISDEVKLNLMGYHLQSDIAHDFGATSPESYNINGATAAAKAGATSINEDKCVEFFLQGPGRAWFDGPTFDARKSEEVIFTVPEKTVSFENWKGPLLFGGGNDKIGIIQDAGEFITQRLGSKNVITFGSILDPAGKPIAPSQNPIWFEPSVNNVDIPLIFFGFDPKYIATLRIQNLTAGDVSALYGKSDQTFLDAIRMIPPSGSLGRKPINNTKVEKAGFFTSIEKASNISMELQALSIDPTTVNPTNFFIGKTLGDTTLVISGMPNIPGGGANPYYGVGSPGWKQWITGETVESPSVLVLKTGDRLNWLRAILFNVGTIYEDQAKGGRKVKQYKYFPGTPNPEAIKTAILADFDKMPAVTERRYQELFTNMRTLLLGDGGIDGNKTNFAPGGMPEIRTPNGRILATKLLGDIGLRLGELSTRVSTWIKKRRQEADTQPNLRAYYQETLDRANACSPQTASIYIQKGRQDPYLTMKLVVANVPSLSDGDDWPLRTSFDIALRNVLRRLNGSSAADESTYKTLLDGTDIQNRFLGKFEMVGGGQSGGDAPLDMDAIRETVNEVVGPSIDANDIQSAGSAQVGGAYVYVDIKDDVRNVLESFPVLKDFIEYLAIRGFDSGKALVQTYDIIRRRTTNRIVDPILLEALVVEFRDLIQEFNHRIEMKNIDPSVFGADYVIEKSAPSSNATILFDAYTYFVNARNSIIVNVVDGTETETQSTADFKSIENAYLERVNITRTRSRKSMLVSPVKGKSPIVRRNLANDRLERPYGGLRTRRPLYSNASPVPSEPIGSEHDARLRKRSRTRRAPRLRQHSRKSRSGGQRKHVDRV